jgi:polysaccharide deacetylase family protein (PEP-CTERM system associated)
MIVNALTVDVEEYYHAAVFRSGTARLGRRPLESRVERSVDELLALMRAHGARATFFVLGEVAALHPAMVRKIAAEGHEIGCHSDRHDNVDLQSPREFRADTRRAKARIEDALGDTVVGYRAPNFSIGRKQSWAYPILVEEGFRYDSSTHPILHDRYGQPGAPRFPHEVYRDGRESLIEFPIGTVRLLGVNLPVGGGGFFRLLPLAVTRLGIAHVNAAERRPVMFYLHPWELDPGQPRPPMGWGPRFRLYVGIEKEAAKLSALLGQFRFGTARDVLASQPYRAGGESSVAAVIATEPGSLS